jgi:hypothetical protein
MSPLILLHSNVTPLEVLALFRPFLKDELSLIFYQLLYRPLPNRTFLLLSFYFALPVLLLPLLFLLQTLQKPSLMLCLKLEPALSNLISTFGILDGFVFRMVDFLIDFMSILFGLGNHRGQNFIGVVSSDLKVSISSVFKFFPFFLCLGFDLSWLSRLNFSVDIVSYLFHSSFK